MIWFLYLAGTYISAFQRTKKVTSCLLDTIHSYYYSYNITGYSGVAIYTRSSLCAPIRAEEGITGILCPPGSSTSFFDLPEDQQIGGYPSISQYGDCTLDAATLDSEGRCVLLEFPAFVLIGTYCPANRDETRDHFRIGFLNVLDARIRNLVAAGKRVILTGDLNIIREEIDTANAQERMRKDGVTAEDFFSTPARRLLNHLVEGGKVYGERDDGREKPVLVDICREFHPGRRGMFTCWEQRKNARPGNFGSRIDYICVSPECKDWFCESNIQEGLMGSDHCPVYTTIKDKVQLGGKEVDIRDIMNPVGMFQAGARQREWTVKDLLSTSAKLIPEFDKRRNIRDMFMKPPLPLRESSSVSTKDGDQIERKDPTTGENYTVAENATEATSSLAAPSPTTEPVPSITSKPEVSKAMNSAFSNGKRTAESSSLSRAPKRTKSGGAKPPSTKNGPAKGQSSLKGFFKPKTPVPDVGAENNATSKSPDSNGINNSSNPYLKDDCEIQGAVSAEDQESQAYQDRFAHDESKASIISDDAKFESVPFNLEDQEQIIDPIKSKESWSKILGKRVMPRCEHNESCITLLTKKPGVNCGRSFFICPRPLGPSGAKEKGTQWRCGTFIWSSEWTSESTS